MWAFTNFSGEVSVYELPNFNFGLGPGSAQGSRSRGRGGAVLEGFALGAFGARTVHSPPPRRGSTAKENLPR